MKVAGTRLHVRLLCAGILLACILGLHATSAAADVGRIGINGHSIIYLGVVYFPKYDGLTGVDNSNLDAIINTFSNGTGATYFTGSAYDVQLVIQAEIGWNATATFNFAPQQQFAQLIQSKHLIWTPLLSYHYLPQAIIDKYGSCNYDSTGKLLGCTGDAMPNTFMPYIPTSAVWSNEAATWTQQAMQALATYFADRSFPYNPANINNPIELVLCGNEMQTAKRPSDPDYPDASYFDTLSHNWANALGTLVNAAKSVAQGRIPVSTKLVPYELYATEMLQRGMFPHVYDLLDSLDVVAIDPYPPTATGYQALFRSDKATYVSEFNDPAGQIASGADLLSWVHLGVQNYNLRYATWFCWECHPTKAGDWDYTMTDTQKQGMRDAINWVTTQGPIYSPSPSVSFQLSTDILSKNGNPTWMIQPIEAGRHDAAISLGSKLPFPVRYEVDYRPRPADVRIQQVIAPQSVTTFGKPSIYLLESPAAQVSASEGTFYTSGNSCCSESKVAYSPSVATGTQVFDWTSQWNAGVRKLEKQGLSSSLGAVRDWIISPDNVPIGEQFGNSFFIAQGTLFELGCVHPYCDNPPPTRPLPKVLGDMIQAALAGTGNPFSYSSVRDEYLTCYGIAGRISSNCRDITDFNDKQMCSALSDRTQSPCTQITDSNLKLACYGMAVAPSYPSNCNSITDPSLRQFCYGVAGYNTSQCAALTDPDTRQLCYAMASNSSSYCGSITTNNLRQFCYGVASQTNASCASIQ